MTRSRQRGVTTVEFAIIGSVMFMVIFGVIEVARAMFVLNALGESTRRAARMAAVCPINDPAIVSAGLFNAPGDGFGALSASNFEVDYLDGNGNVLGDPVAGFAQIQFVRSRIVGFQHEMLIPFGSYLFVTPDFATTLRRESLGVPREGVLQPC